MKREAIGVVGVVLLTASTLGGHLAAQDHMTFIDPAAENLFRYSRMAVGGGAVSKLKGLILKGRSRFAGNDGAEVHATVVIKMLLPDNYLRIDSAGGVDKVAGYSGKTVLSAIRQNGNVEYPPSQLVSQILKNEKQRASRLLLGATTFVTSDEDLRFGSVGRSAEMVDPRESARSRVAVDDSTTEPNVLGVRGSDNFSARLVVDSTTRAPLRLTFAGGGNTEVVMTFENRRAVDGLQLPFHVGTTVGGRLFDDLLFDEILVNPELGKGDFKK